MAKNILITDSLFVFQEHVRQLEAAGFAVERLDKPNASESELCTALTGKHGYILGGIEHVTAPVLKAATSLEAIAFTGSGFTEFIPAHDEATRRGIAISAAVGGNAIDVAEFTIALLFEMVRNLPLLQSPKDQGGKGFYIAHRLRGLTLGIVGYGHIGQEVARLASNLGLKVLVHSRREARLSGGMAQVSLTELIQRSDVITVHVDKRNGTNVLGASEIQQMKKGTVLINAAFPEAVDASALAARVESGEVRAAFDAASHVPVKANALGDYVASNAQTAFNTAEANKQISDRVTKSLINLLTTGADADLVNPTYRQFRDKRG